MAYKQHDFAPDGYGDESIVETPEVYFQLLDHDRTTQTVYTVQERHLTSEERLFGAGFDSQNKTYYHLDK